MKEILGVWSVDVQYGPGAQSDDYFVFFEDGTGRYEVWNWAWCSSNLFNWRIEGDELVIEGTKYYVGGKDDSYDNPQAVEDDDNFDMRLKFKISDEMTPSDKTMRVLRFDEPKTEGCRSTNESFGFLRDADEKDRKPEHLSNIVKEVQTVLFDMETSDPDDVAALCFLCYHPLVDLKAVTVTPGTLDQIGLVKSILKMCDKNIPVGSRKPDHPKDCVSGFFRKHYKIEPAQPAGLGHEIIHDHFRMYKQKARVLLTGAALGNPREALEKHDDIVIPKWVGQGGFAGDSVVPEQFRLEKFKGMESCPTFNFNGDRKGAALMLESKQVNFRRLVSKNVCHGMVFDKAMCDAVLHPNDNPAFNTFFTLMTKYLQDHPQGKLFHDPLAAATIVEPAVCAYEGVEVYYEKGGWGSRKKKGTGTRISISADREKFIEVLKCSTI